MTHTMNELLAVLSSVCQEFRIESLQPQLHACAEALEEGNIVDVAVVGRFKAGKSSFLNHIVGANLLPVGVLPVTAIVTRMRYGPRDRAVVQLHDGSMQEVPMDRLADFVTEQRNPENVKGAAIVDVELTSLRHYRGIRFVDTPGLGSVFAHNTRASVEWLPRVGAALLAVSIDQPISEYDVGLLKELGKHTPEISILLTKADLVSPEELHDVIRFISEQVGKVLTGNVRVLPFSIRPGYELLRKEAEEYLLQHVSARYAEKSEEIIRHKLRSLIAGCREYLHVALSAASAATEARAQLQQQLLQERRDLSTVRNEIWLLSNDFKDRLVTAALEQFLSHYPDLRERLVRDLRSESARWKGNLKKTTEAFEQWAQAALRAQLAPLLREEGDRLAQRQLAAALASFSRVVRAFQDRLAKSIEEALHISFTGAAFEATVKKPRRPDVSVGRVFDTPLELVWFLIPMALFRPLVQHHFLRALPREVEKNLYRAAAQWREAIGRSIDDLAGQAQVFIREELATLEGLVAKAQDQRPAIELALSLLNDERAPGECGDVR